MHFKIVIKQINQDKYEEALSYFNQSLEIMEEIVLPNDSLLENVIYNIGLTFDYKGEYEEALKYYKESLEISKQTLPPNDSTIAETLQDIGLVYLHQGKYIY